MDKKIDGIIFGQPTVDLRSKKADLNDEQLIKDLAKRRFIRAIGVVGVGAFLYSLITKKAQAIVFGSGQKTRDNADILGTLALESDGNLETLAGKDFATSAKQDTGNTSLGTIKTNTDTLVASGGGGYIRQDSTYSIARETGGNLATIAGKDFATQTTLALIKAKTDNLDTALSGIKTGTDKIPASPATESGNLATIVTNTNKIPASPATEGGNLATISTNTGKITDALAQYKFSDEYITTPAGTVYRGYLDKDGNWFIVKETITADSRTYRYKKGTSDYTTNWTGRAGLTYNYFDTEF